MVIVHDRVEGLDPLGINITVANDPANGLLRLLDYLPRTRSQHTVLELTSVVVHLAQELLSRHGLGVHNVGHDLFAHLLVGLFDCLPDGGLAAAGGAD